MRTQTIEKRIGILLALILAVCCLVPMLAACSGKTPSAPSEVTVSLDVAEKQAYVGDTFKLTATVQNTDDKVLWFSSASEVAQVDGDGNVSVISVGKADITALVGGKQASCAVTVVNSPYPTLSLGLSSTVVYIGYTRTVTPTVMLGGEVKQATVTFASSDDSVATIDANGVITGKKEGSVTITASTTVDGTPLTRSVDVTVKTMSFFYMNDEVTLSHEDGMYADDYPHSARIAYTGFLDGVQIEAADVEWKIEDSAVASVSSDGVVTAVGAGKTTLTASSGSISETCDVVVAPQVRELVINDLSDATDMIIAERNRATCTQSRVTTEVGGRTPAAPQGFVKSEITNFAANADNVYIDVKFDKTVYELIEMQSVGYSRVVIPVYMEFKDAPADGSDFRTISGEARQNLSWSGLYKDTNDGYNSMGNVGALYNKRWNLVEYEIGFMIDRMRNGGGKIGADSTIRLVLKVNDDGTTVSPAGHTPTDIYVDAAYAERGTTLRRHGFCDRFENQYGEFRYTQMSTGGITVSYAAETVGDRAPDGAGYVKYNVDGSKIDGYNGSVVIVEKLYGTSKNTYLIPAQTMKAAGYTHVAFAIYVKADGATGTYKIDERLRTASNADNVRYETTNEFNKWISFEMPIDEYIEYFKRNTANNTNYASDHLMMMRLGITVDPSVTSFDVYLGNVTAVKK